MIGVGRRVKNEYFHDDKLIYLSMIRDDDWKWEIIKYFLCLSKNK